MNSGIFDRRIFEKTSEEELYKQQMEGFADPSLGHFQLLSVASLAKDQFKHEQYELEYIYSYLNAAKELASIGESKSSQPGMVVFYRHSYALPILYLTRHCMELSIKRAIGGMGRQPKTTHGLTGLWSSFLSCCQGKRSNSDEPILKAMGKYVSCIDRLDPTGTKLRYSTSKDEYSINRPLWVDSKRTTQLLEQFVNQLEALNTDEESTTNQ